MARNRTKSDEGFTVVELLLAVTLTVVLAVGVSSTFASSVTSIGGSRNTSFTSSGNATINSVFTRDVESANGFLVPDNASVDAISAVSGNGTSVTYTYSAKNTLSVGQNVSVLGNVPAGYNAVNAQVQSFSATNHTFTLNNTTIGALTTSGSLVTQCSSWNPADSTFASTRPLLTLSQQAGAPITAASGTGTVMTYTYSGPISFSAGQTVTISGLIPAGYNVLNATVVAANPNGQTFTVAGSATGSLTTAGTMVYNNFIGYEVRSSSDKNGQLWRIHCAVPSLGISDASAQLLRSGLPQPSSDADWVGTIQCASSTGTSVVASSCPANTFLNSTALYPGIKFAIPPTLLSATNLYPLQVILASRSIA